MKGEQKQNYLSVYVLLSENKFISVSVHASVVEPKKKKISFPFGNRKEVISHH